MKFSVVVVNYDSWPLTLRCIESLRKTGYKNFETVIVNNDSASSQSLPVNVTLIQNPANLGFARACNEGISATIGDYVILINPDTLVERDFFERVEKFFIENPRAGIAGPRIIDAGGNLQLSARRELGFFSGLMGRTSFLTRVLPKSAAVRRMFPAAEALGGSSEVDWVSGACMIIRRSVLEDIGPVDERFFMYFEDADLCRRSRGAGYSVYYLPHVEVLHLTGASSRSKPRAIWRLHKSAFLYHRKHNSGGPLGLYSVFVFLGLCARALVKLVSVPLK